MGTRFFQFSNPDQLFGVQRKYSRKQFLDLRMKSRFLSPKKKRSLCLKCVSSAIFQ